MFQNGIWHGPMHVFIALTKDQDVLESTLIRGFKQVHYQDPDAREVTSWRNSLPALAQVLEEANLTGQYVALEYPLPRCDKRLDALIVGMDEQGSWHAVIIELKQWTKAESDERFHFVQVPGTLDGCHEHPSSQAASYAAHLGRMYTTFHSNKPPFRLSACAYLHNAFNHSVAELFDSSYQSALNAAPLFTQDNKKGFQKFLTSRLGAGGGSKAWQKIEQGETAPAKELLDELINFVTGNPTYTLLDTQRAVYNQLWTQMNKRHGQRQVILVSGGPGTGKTVIALHILAALARRNHEERKPLSFQFSVGSKALRVNLQAKAGTAQHLFTYYDSTRETLDVRIADEAHRLRSEQVLRKLIARSTVTLLLQDDYQIISPGEDIRAATIARIANEMGAQVTHFTLTDQFRCEGARGYIEWIDQLLQVTESGPHTPWRHKYQFELVDSPQQLEEALCQHPSYRKNTRLVAGFCWPWTQTPLSRDPLVLKHDIQIGSWSRPWNRSIGNGPQPENDPYTIWASTEEGFDEVGCIYSIQNFEYDYVGVILGPDFVWRNGRWDARPDQSYDKVWQRFHYTQDATFYLRNIYRVLLTRGRKGTYLFVTDEETRTHIQKTLMEL